MNHTLTLKSTGRIDTKRRDSKYNASCSCGTWRAGNMVASEARESYDRHMQAVAGPEAQDARRSPLTGEAYPLCACGKIVYSDGLCYRCFQAQDARERAS